MPVDNHLLQILSSSEAQESQIRHSKDNISAPLLAAINVALEENQDHSPEDSLLLKSNSGDHSNHSSFRKSIEKSLRSVSVIVDENQVPDMWSRDYIGLYCQYAAIGLLYGTSGALNSLCIYVYDGSPNTCANALNITFFAWSFKIFFAVITDTYRPFGLRRKSWMLFGWTGTLALLFVLALVADRINSGVWLGLLVMVQFFAMFSDVPADGYSVELGQLESKERRGQILATGQMIRFIFCIVAGMIQSFLLNGPSTSQPDCPIGYLDCWSWGLSINQYYALLFCMVFVLVIPVVWLKELDPSKIPRHTLSHFAKEIWLTLQNLTTLNIIIFVIGTDSLTNFTVIVNKYIQYDVIKLTNFQSGIDTITTYMAVSSAIWVFKTYLINRNWRMTQYGSTFIASCTGLLWILVYYNIGGLRNPWFTIIIDLDQQFVQGIVQVLFSMSVIELSKPGLEATTYELIITVANSALTVSSIIATQLLTPLKVSGCTSSVCSSNTVNISGPTEFEESDGPYRYTIYSVVLVTISISCCLLATPFLPKDKDQCHEWKEKGELAGNSVSRGYLTLFLAVTTTVYGAVVAILLLNPATSCLEIVGGPGC